MLVKTVSWRQQSEHRYRRPTMSPQMPQKPPIPPDQMTNRTRSLSLTARVPSLSTALTARHQPPTKRKVPPANTRLSLCPARPSSVYSPIVRPLPTESLRTKKTTIVTRKRRAKRTIWSLQLLLPVILGLRQILQTTVPQHLKALDHLRAAAPNPPTLTVLMTMVHYRETLKKCIHNVCCCGGWLRITCCFDSVIQHNNFILPNAMFLSKHSCIDNLSEMITAGYLTFCCFSPL